MSDSETAEYDVIIVGAGFAGVHQLLKIRKLGLTAKILETGEDLSGTWLWNKYPGARVDSPMPIYQFSDPAIWQDWSFTEYYPDWREIQAYFRYVDHKFNVKQDVSFSSRVISAHWNDSVDRWTVTTEDGRVFRGQFLSLCTGIASKYHIPEFKGIASFKGEVHHTARWPEEYDFKGKRVGVIGTGSTGVQVIQEIAPIVSHLTVFQRTPNLALPMKQRKISVEEQDKLKKELYPIFYGRRNQTFSGFLHDLDPKPMAETTLEERTLAFEDRWDKGGFHFWLGSYSELFLVQKYNDEAYAFWRRKVRERIPDPELQEKLAPMQAPHPFGVKRPSLEQRYFEVYSQSNVTLVNISKTPIEQITRNGLQTNDGTEHVLDVLVFATGFDMVTGGITSIDIRGQDGVSIKEKWADGVRSYLGVASATYPNMFWIYGPQSPSSFSNGPSSIELTSEWIIDCIKFIKENNISSIVPTEEAQHAYSEHVNQLGSIGLWAGAKTSWYLGNNIQGKKTQMLQFPGGIPAYAKLCNDSAARGYDGFDLKRSSA
ncbi:cyclohexanone monooxygenase [Lentinula aciculospora]|uniref:Cyclohexanone monooxygenase n=1 Tax=Lentinula aciculospora TaxID=153920 RepID=A0A9W9DN54_9AGAR|nr:cyclohexanone monooxygenase [Lentinula aciculospora]